MTFSAKIDPGHHQIIIILKTGKKKRANIHHLCGLSNVGRIYSLLLSRTILK